MGFLSAYSGVVTIDLTSPDDPHGHYWVLVKKTLSGAELDIAEGKRTQTAFTGDPGRAAQARADAAKARAARTRLGLPELEDSEQTPAVEMSVKIDQAAYRLELLTLAVSDWNLTDEHDRPLPLAPLDAKRASLKRLPAQVYNRLVEAVESQVQADQAPRDDEAEAQFRPGVEEGRTLRA